MMNMAKILYTDKKLICYVSKLQNIVLYFDFQYIQKPLLLLFKGFNEKFKIKDPTLEGLEVLFIYDS